MTKALKPIVVSFQILVPSTTKAPLTTTRKGKPLNNSPNEATFAKVNY